MSQEVRKIFTPSQLTQELKQEIESRSIFLTTVLESEGEITPFIENAINSTNQNIQTLADNIFGALDALDFEIAYRKDEMKKMRERVAKLEEIEDRVRSTLKRILKEPLRGTLKKASVSSNGFELLPEKEDLSDVPERYLRRKEVVELNKSAIQDEIKLLSLQTVADVERAYPFLKPKVSLRLTISKCAPKLKDKK